MRKLLAVCLLGLSVLAAPAARGAQGPGESRLFFSMCPPADVPDPVGAGESCPGGTNELYSMAPGGGEPVRLTDNQTFEQAIVPSDGRHRLAYATSDEFMECGFDGQIVAMDFDGADHKQLTSDDERRCKYPTDWSPDGRAILYTRAENLASNVMTVRPRTGATRQLTGAKYESDDYAGGAMWLDGGRRVVYTGPGKRSTDLIVADRDGSDARPIRSDRLHDTGLAVSPDGRWIAYVASSRSVGPDVFVIRPDGSDRTRLTFSSDLAEDHLQWSSDGRQLVFQSFRHSDGLESWITTVDRDGSDLTHLTEDATDHDRAWAPFWSPDDGRIAYVGESWLGGQTVHAIFVMDADGTDRARLTEWGEYTWLWGWLAPPVD